MPLLSPDHIPLQDVYQWLEQYSPHAARGLLTWVLPFVRPFSRGRWFRIARLNDEEVEVVIPYETSNTDGAGGIHSAIIFGAALEAATLFWWRHLPENPKIKLGDMAFKSIRKGSGELRLCAQIPEKSRELTLYSLRNHSTAEIEIPFKAFDENRNLIAEVDIKLEIGITPRIGRKPVS
ncbi:MAG: hypothetical protein V4736_00480 [Bdellovibrionota bacterium]